MISKRNIDIIGVYAFFILVISIWSFNLSDDCYIALKWLGGICLLELVVFIICSSTLNGRLLSYSTIFISVLFVFNFGQLQINTFFVSIYSHVRFLLLLTPESALRGFQWINLSFNAICFGICLACAFANRVSLRDKMYQQANYAFIAKKIITITFPIKVIIDILCIYVSITSGGVAARTWLNEFPNVLVFWGKISLVGFALLIASLKQNPKKQLRLFLFIEIYILIMMISGIRSENVGYILIFLLIYLSTRQKKVRAAKYIFYCIISIPILAFIIAVGEFRLVPDKNFASFFEIYKQALTEKNVILSLFDTCGDTGYTALCVITKWLPNYSPSYGFSYVGGLFSAIPNIPPIFTLPGDITEASCFALKLQEYGTLSQGYTNIGGSLIGELFFNFGLVGGVLFSVVVGLFIGQINRKCLLAVKGYYYELIMSVPVMFTTIYWVRSYFGGGVREATWGFLIAYLVLKYSKKECR